MTVLLGMTGAVPAQASYVDFTESVNATVWRQEVDGVTITLSRSLPQGGDVFASSDFGALASQGRYATPTGTGLNNNGDQGLRLWFSEEVTINAFDLFDFDRHSYNVCPDGLGPCPTSPVGSSLLTYSIDLDGPVAVAAGAPLSPGAVNYRTPEALTPFGETYQRAGFISQLYGGASSLEGYAFTEVVARAGTEVLFFANPLAPALAQGANRSENFVIVGLRGVDFEIRRATNPLSVPELSASGLAPAICLILGAFAVVTGRRRTPR